MGGVEGQRLHALLPQVQQQAGVHHGRREAAQLVAVAGGEVLGRAAVVTLHGVGGQGRGSGPQLCQDCGQTRHFMLKPAGQKGKTDTG